MRVFNYQEICQELFQNLPQRQKEIILRRFGLKNKEKETLEAIGRDFGITRERVRQIEKNGFSKIKPNLVQYQKVFQYFSKYLKKHGGLKKEEILLRELGTNNQKAYVYFLLTISGNFKRFPEDKNFHSFWAINSESFKKAKEIIEIFLSKFKEIGRPLNFKELKAFSGLKSSVLISYLEISKRILQNQDGLYGLKDWPEINPKGVKDKIYLVFKKIGKPLHFQEVAKLIEGALVQTVHNELIKDPRFVLVGRGIYALKEWGYIPGQVKDVIAEILKQEGPLTQKEILERVLKQRLVKESTVLFNLNKHFLKDSGGRYQIKEI